MKLVSFELKKLFSGKIKWILFFVFLINGVIYYVSLIPSIPTKQEMEIKKEWQRILDKNYDSEDEKLQFIQKQQNEFSNLSMYFTDSQWIEEEQKEQIIKKYKGTKYWNEDAAIAASRVFSKISNEYQSVLEYKTFIHGLEEKANQMVNVPIFSKKRGFSNRNIQKTAKDFQQMKGIEIEPVDGTVLERLQNFYLTDILMIVLICLFCFQQSGQDNRMGMANLIQVTPNGKGKLRFAQSCAVWIAVIVSGIGLYGSNILITVQCFQLNEIFSKYIQAISTFRNVPFPLTIGMYIVVYLMGKLAAIFFIAVICQLVSVKLNGGSLAWILFGIMVCISFLLWFLLPDSPMAKTFQYLNLIGVLDIKQIIGNYQNLNLFSYPVSLSLAIVVFITVISFFAIILIMKVRKIEWKVKRLGKQTDSGKHVWNSVFYYEQYKVFWKQKIWLIITLLVGIALSEFGTKEQFVSVEEFFYNQYITEVEGVYTEEKNQIIEQISSDPKITNMEQRKALEVLKKQSQNLQSQSSKNIAFLNEKKMEKFFCDTQREMKNTIIIVIAMLLSIHSLFYQERKTNMYSLLHVMPRNRQIYWNKMKVSGLLGGVYTLIIWSAVYAQYFLKYGIQDTKFLIQSLYEFGTMPVSCTILQYMIVTMIIRIGIGIYLGIILAFFAELFVNPTQNIIIGSILFIFPTCLNMIGNMGYQNPLVGFIRDYLSFFLIPFQLVTSLQCKWYQVGIGVMVIFVMLPFAVIICGYNVWNKQKVK